MLRTPVARAWATSARTSTLSLGQGVAHRPLPFTTSRFEAFACTGRGAGRAASATAGAGRSLGLPPPRGGGTGQPVCGGAGGNGRSTALGRGAGRFATARGRAAGLG